MQAWPVPPVAAWGTEAPGFTENRSFWSRSLLLAGSILNQAELCSEKSDKSQIPAALRRDGEAGEGNAPERLLVTAAGNAHETPDYALLVSYQLTKPSLGRRTIVMPTTGRLVFTANCHLSKPSSGLDSAPEQKVSLLKHPMTPEKN